MIPVFPVLLMTIVMLRGAMTHEETLKLVRENDFVSGQYVWTGFDYIGEPTPFGWPAHSSYFGIVDLAGFPKDAYYLYQSEWSKKTSFTSFPALELETRTGCRYVVLL